LDGDESDLTALTAGIVQTVGVDPHQFRATLNDQFGDPWTSPASVVFSYRLDGDPAWTFGATRPAANGMAVWDSFQAPAGLYQVRAEVGTLQVGVVVEVEFADPALDFTAIRASFQHSVGSLDPAGTGGHWARISVENILGAVVADESVRFELDPAGSAFFAATNGTPLANPLVVTASAVGAAAVSVRSTGDTTAHLVVTVRGQVVGEADFVFASGPVPPAPHAGNTVLTVPTAAGGATRVADGTDQHRAEASVRDSSGSQLPGGQVLFSWSYPGPNGIETGSQSRTAGTDGVAVFEFSSPVAAVWTIAATIGGVHVTNSPQTATFEAASGPRAAPAQPSVEPSNGQHVVGRVVPPDEAAAAAGLLEVVIADGSGEIARCAVGTDGEFDCALPTGLPHGTELSVWIEDDQGLTSPAVAVRIDTVPPAAGDITPSDGSSLTGEGEAGNEIVATDAAGGELCRAQVASDGTWSCQLAPAAAEGDLVTIVQRDAAGNEVDTVWRIGLPRVEVANASVARGDTQTATGINFQPGELVSAVMRSNPLDVGDATVVSDGRVSFTWTVPGDTDTGTHQIELTGSRSGTSETSFVVSPVPAAGSPTPSATGGPAQGASGSGAAGTAAGSASPGGAGLPITGATASGPIAMLALALVAAGALLFTAGRRRRKA
jgi:hypothetical protein